MFGQGSPRISTIDPNPDAPPGASDSSTCGHGLPEKDPNDRRPPKTLINEIRTEKRHVGWG